MSPLKSVKETSRPVQFANQVLDLLTILSCDLPYLCLSSSVITCDLTLQS